MAIEFFDGFDGGSTQAAEWTEWLSVSATGAGRSGLGLSNIAGADGHVTLTLPASTRKTVGFAFRSDSRQFTSSGQHFISFRSGTTYHTLLTISATGNIQLRFGTSTGTVLQTSTVAVVADVWNYLEMQATIANTGGIVIVRLNGVEAINYTGDTQNSGTTSIDNLSWSWLRSDTYGSIVYDDVYVVNETDATATTGRPDNTFLGEVKVELLQPNGNGALSQWAGSDGNSTDNYQLVDEMPPNPVDYLSAATAGQQDFWAMTDLSATADTVFAVQPILHVQKSDAGPATMRSVLRDSGGTVANGPAIALGTGWATVYGNRHTTRPAGGAWTVADVNALQLGVERT